MKRSSSPAFLAAALLAASLGASPQALPEPSIRKLTVRGTAMSLSYVVQLPPEYVPGQRYPLLLLLPDGAADVAAAEAAVQAVGAEIARGGFVVVSPAVAGREAELGAL